jgi:hypothetical protein
MITITDHALVRYLERVHGFDLEPLRKGIMAAVALGAAARARSVVKNDFTYSLTHDGKQTVVVTILPSKYRRRKTAPQKRGDAPK